MTARILAQRSGEGELCDQSARVPARSPAGHHPVTASLKSRRSSPNYKQVLPVTVRTSSASGNVLNATLASRRPAKPYLGRTCTG
jgi:hypothetical protein